ncbi:MAG TPA: hypothetical protein VGV17_14350 [Bosea sp. (in: a-proteobacteria)]|jgi:hypothetical protein|uniref:hypothetical protein n=1 Tax=Bosea sp. (in: a-proteobacteria) TaxID=1871050 RepID=UPI002DDD440D|nr:hypothetical protein [Bosea sp. (in: a-proteobacteria)]HEV2554934.1 hypothetical protein [Bosea sp. (in: a-proteobacteria)]
MPFPSVTNPADLARAQVALDTAWQKIREENLTDGDDQDRIRVAYIIAGFLPMAEDEDEDELVRRAIAKFKEP